MKNAAQMSVLQLFDCQIMKRTLAKFKEYRRKNNKHQLHQAIKKFVPLRQLSNSDGYSTVIYYAHFVNVHENITIVIFKMDTNCVL